VCRGYEEEEDDDEDDDVGEDTPFRGDEGIEFG